MSTGPTNLNATLAELSGSPSQAPNSTFLQPTGFRILIDRKNYPNLEFAQDCLFKVFSTNTGYSIGHKKHLDIQEKYGDTLLEKYPNYANKKQLLEGLISNIDLNPNVRDTSKMRHYYNILLKCEGLNNSYILETKKRMKRLDLNVIEYANHRNK